MKNINKYKNENGITLIVLIITIIIMLILLSVVADIAFDGKLLDSSKNAVKINDNKLVKQQGEVEDIITEKDEIDVDNKGKPRRVFPGEKAQETSIYIDEFFKAAIIPKGFTVSKAPTECTIDDGLVVYLIDDKTQEEIDKINWTDETEIATLRKTYDQFVWIPVDDINEMYMCQLEGTDTDGSGKVEYDEYSSCNITVDKGEAYCTTHNSNLMAGRLYATTYGKNFDINLTTQTYKQGSDFREPDTVSEYDGKTTYLDELNGILKTSYSTESDFKTALQEEYNETVKSVYENKGFYIGRYETSGMAQEVEETKYDVAVVAGTLPSAEIDWYHMYAQQKNYSKANNLTVGSTMIQGAAYDQVMKFVNTDTYDITSSIFVSHDLEEAYQTGGLNYSGTKTYNDFSKNIFDLEGNVFAWTTEAYDTHTRINRGRSV